MIDTLAPLQNLSNALSGLVANLAPSIVSIHSRQSRSSGFVWRHGLIVTAEEALPEEGEISMMLPGGDLVSAQLAGRDATTDVALLRTDTSKLVPITQIAAPVSAGTLAVALGAEDGTPTAAIGIVSRRAGSWRSLRGGEIDARIDFDMRLRQTAEGGLAVDGSGQAIGMVVFGPRQRVIAIPFSTVERVATRLDRHGRIPRGYLGLGLQPVAIEDGGRAGAMVMSVDPEGPGAAAGILQGDILIAWEGEPLRDVHSLSRSLGPDSVGKTVALGLRRAGERQQIALTIGERPAT
jgi:S1-C subfamily serine protease